MEAGPVTPPAATTPAESDDAAALPAGHRINEYVLERPLGGGGFGITYLAHDSNLQLPVAIKEYFPSDLVTRGADLAVQVRSAGAQQEQFDWGLERFLDEARALATFRHPNIVRVLRYFRANGTAYIVMEYESGLPLKRWVPQNAPLTRRTVLALVLPLLDGLEAVHNTGFLHRDIKPDNIFVRADGTPVLLDFGAARRVSANRDLTNIVSPGFAPFEQYHSHGNQGPWTDIYSLGAVMYWMVTGRKPFEAAARIKTDPMPLAAELADAGQFGAELLRAIDWALTPDEGRRPQNVALLRAAVDALPASPAQVLDIDLQDDVPPSSSTTQPPLAVPSTATAAASLRNVLCTIMFLDLVGYSARSVEDQAAIKKQFTELVGGAVRTVPEDTRIAIDTGDGAAICFLGDPEEALASAMLLRDLLGKRKGLSARIGLHLGPVRIIADINARTNVIGDGINVAQRIMDFAAGGQLLVSRAYYDVISRITDDKASLFHFMGQFEDKHGRPHEVYAVGRPRDAGQTGGNAFTETLPVRPVQPLDPAEVHEVENDLARHIGPLAKVLARKALARATSLAALREALAPSIPDAKARDAFLSAGQSHPVSRGAKVTNSRPLPPASPTHAPSGSASAPLGRSRPPGTRGIQSMPLPVHRTGEPSGPSKPIVDATDKELAVIERALGLAIGPMARMLVRRQAARCVDFADFVDGVAGTIDQPAARAQFLETVRRALPRRLS